MFLYPRKKVNKNPTKIKKHPKIIVLLFTEICAEYLFYNSDQRYI